MQEQIQNVLDIPCHVHILRLEVRCADQSLVRTTQYGQRMPLL